MTLSPCIICEHLDTKKCELCFDHMMLQTVTAVSVWKRYKYILHYIFDNQIQDPEPAEEIKEEKE